MRTLIYSKEIPIGTMTGILVIPERTVEEKQCGAEIFEKIFEWVRLNECEYELFEHKLIAKGKQI